MEPGCGSGPTHQHCPMFNNISYVLKFFKMLYHIVCLVTSLLKFTAKLFWLCCLLTSASIPWITFTILAACIGSRFCRLPHHNKKRISYLLESVGDGKSLHWPIANKGAFYDAPENSVAALNNVSKICVLQYNLVYSMTIIIYHLF